MKSGRLAIFLLCILGFLVYFNSLFNGFLLDDEGQIVNNNLVHSIKNFPVFLTSSTFYSGGHDTNVGNFYRPTMTIAFSALYSAFGPNPFIFHAFQIILHIINSILVFLLFRFFLKKPLPLFLAAVFLIHPINSETVNYISTLQDILFFLFGMLALILKLARNNKSAILIYPLIFLSLLSKESGFLFIAIILIYDLLFKKKFLTDLIVFTLLTISYFFIRFQIAHLPLSVNWVAPINLASFSERLITIPKIILYYLKTFIFPMELSISHNWIVKSISSLDFYFPLAILILLSGLIIAWLKLSKNIFLFFLAWFIIGMAAISNIFPLDMTVADHWFYFPIVGLLGMIGVFLHTITNKSDRLRQILIVSLILLIGLYSLRTFFRNFNFKDGLTLYSHDIRFSPNSFDLENNLAHELYRSGRIDEAQIHAERSVKLAPHYWTNWSNLGAIYHKQGKIEEAKRAYLNALNRSDFYVAYENLAVLLVLYDNPATAKSFIEDSLKKFPKNSNLWLYLALAEYKLNNRTSAINAAKKSYQLSPNDKNFDTLHSLENKVPIEVKFQ